MEAIMNDDQPTGTLSGKKFVPSLWIGGCDLEKSELTVNYFIGRVDQFCQSDDPGEDDELIIARALAMGVQFRIEGVELTGITSLLEPVSGWLASEKYGNVIIFTKNYHETLMPGPKGSLCKLNIDVLKSWQIEIKNVLFCMDLHDVPGKGGTFHLIGDKTKGGRIPGKV